MVLIFILQIVLEALSNGFYDKQRKKIYHELKLLSYLVVIAPLMFPEIIGIDFLFTSLENRILIACSYPLFRFAIFDAVYNKVRGLTFFAMGTTCRSDLWLRRFVKWTNFQANHLLFWLKVFALIGAMELSGVWTFIENVINK